MVFLNSVWKLFRYWIPTTKIPRGVKKTELRCVKLNDPLWWFTLAWITFLSRQSTGQALMRLAHWKQNVPAFLYSQRSFQTSHKEGSWTQASAVNLHEWNYIPDFVTHFYRIYVSNTLSQTNSTGVKSDYKIKMFVCRRAGLEVTLKYSSHLPCLLLSNGLFSNRRFCFTNLIHDSLLQ